MSGSVSLYFQELYGELSGYAGNHFREGRWHKDEKRMEAILDYMWKLRGNRPHMLYGGAYYGSDN